MTDLHALFASLSESFLAEVPAKLTQLRDLIDAAETDAQAVNDLARHAHQLAGSAGTFSQPELGEHARVLLDKVYPLTDEQRTITTDEHAHLRGIVDVMEASTPPLSR